MGLEQSSGEEFRPLTEAVNEWGKSLMGAQRVDAQTQSGVLSYGRSVEDLDAVTVFVAPHTDLSDAEVFPAEVDGTRVIYRNLPIAEAY